MPEHIEGLDPPPLYFPCDPMARQFPIEWRDTLFRRNAVRASTGELLYYCPICKLGFDHSNIDFLQGDHIWPYSLFGETSWANYQLICGSCNARKRNFIDDAIRRILGDGLFRRTVSTYLNQAAKDDRIDRSELIVLRLVQTSDGESP